MKKFKVYFIFEKEHSNNIVLQANNSNEIIEKIEKSNWIGNEEIQINLANVTSYKIRKM
ncbi:hypothetical protein [Bacillus thuringiensis]